LETNKEVAAALQEAIMEKSRAGATLASTKSAE
jgi:hypothetical protein